jgi:hypothetical protein
LKLAGPAQSLLRDRSKGSDPASDFAVGTAIAHSTSPGGNDNGTRYDDTVDPDDVDDGGCDGGRGRVAAHVASEVTAANVSPATGSKSPSSERMMTMFSLPIFLNVPSLESIPGDGIAFPALASFLIAYLVISLMGSIFGLLREHSSNSVLPPRNEKLLSFEPIAHAADVAHKAAA